MNDRKLLSLAMAIALAALLVGCGKEHDVTSLTCADYDKITDPAQKAELLKRCPRIPRDGDEFKPSPKKEY